MDDIEKYKINKELANEIKLYEEKLINQYLK